MRKLFLALFITIGIPYSYAQTPLSFNTQLESVTVYSRGAELNHKAKVNLPAGSSEIILNNVANAIDENSIQISMPANVSILSTSFVRDHLKPEQKSIAYLKVEDSLVIVRRNMNSIQNKRQVAENLLLLLDKNQSVGSTNTGVNVAELIKIAEYYKTKQLELRNDIYALKEAETLQQKKIEKMQQQLSELSTDKSGTTGQLVLQLMSDQTINSDVYISYLSPNAYWVANYDLRAENTTVPLKIIYKANINQYTGLNWKKVKLRLSTGNPSQNGTAPDLSAWFLQYRSPQITGALQGSIPGIQTFNKKADQAQLNEVIVVGYGANMDKHVIQREQMLNAVFDIDIPYDIASNNKAHSVSLKEFSQPANFKYYSVPKLDGDAFLMAQITGYEKLNLLPGQANMIFENSYVGKSYIDPNATTDTLNLSMGRDKKISIKREKIAETTGAKLIGNSKRQVFTYEITLRNGKKEAVELMLKDQYPISTNKDMEIELLSATGAAVDKETGILSWNLTLKPGVTQKIRISYAVKYPKNKDISNL